MERYKKIALIAYFLVIVQTRAENDTYTEAQIAELEKERTALYRQISDAIDDSIKTFHGSNDTDVQLGLKYILDLKQQFQKLNGTNATDNNQKNNKTRRFSANEDKEFTDKLFRDKDKSPKKKQQYEARELMEERVREWIIQREEEKKKLKKYKEKESGGKNKGKEKCPAGGRKKGGKKGKKSMKYPCCRKCCKQSYLGCL